MREHWTLDPEVTFLNHGSFGACPREVLARQQALRERMEREPVDFFLRQAPPLLEEARERVAAFVGAAPEDLGFVPNATAGINAVLRSLRFEPGDELLVTDHGYRAATHVARYVAERWGAKVVTAAIPFPLASEEDLVAPILDAVTDRTRLALLDHVSSPTGIVLPMLRLVDELHARQVDTLVDGAHAPGMIPLDVESLGAAYYVANFHKWTCAPKGAAMLWVRPDMQDGVHPATISHGYAGPRRRKAFLEELDWQGTLDPTPAICVPAALDFVGGLLDGGWPAIQRRNRALALEARATLAEALGVSPPVPEAMIGSLAALPLPDGPGDFPAAGPEGAAVLLEGALQRRLFEAHRVEVPVSPWPAPPRRLLRVSAFLYNTGEDYARLAEALGAEL